MVRAEIHREQLRGKASRPIMGLELHATNLSFLRPGRQRVVKLSACFRQMSSGTRGGKELEGGWTIS